MPASREGQLSRWAVKFTAELSHFRDFSRESLPELHRIIIREGPGGGKRPAFMRALFLPGASSWLYIHKVMTRNGLRNKLQSVPGMQLRGVQAITAVRGVSREDLDGPLDARYAFNRLVLEVPRYNLSDYVNASINESNIETKMAIALGHALQGSRSLFASLSSDIAQQIAVQALQAQVEYLPEGIVYQYDEQGIIVDCGTPCKRHPIQQERRRKPQQYLLAPPLPSGTKDVDSFDLDTDLARDLEAALQNFPSPCLKLEDGTTDDWEAEFEKVLEDGEEMLDGEELLKALFEDAKA